MRSVYKLYSLYRALAAVLLLAMGLLQAWDSGAFAAPAAVLCQILAAVMLPPGAALWSRRGGVWGAAVAVSALLLILVRPLSPRPLPALLTLVTFQAAVLYLLFQKMQGRRGKAPQSAAVSREVGS